MKTALLLPLSCTLAVACARPGEEAKTVSLAPRAATVALVAPDSSLKLLPRAPEAAPVRAHVLAEARLARGRVLALIDAVKPLSGATEMTARLELARDQLDRGLELLGDERSATDAATSRGALLNLKAAPLSLSLFALDVPFAVRWKKLPPDMASRLEKEAREVRRSIEELTARAELLLRSTTS